MQKQHFTTEVAWVVNPPLLSTFQQTVRDSMENVYASKAFALGRSTLSNMPKELKYKRFGIATKPGDSASFCIHPTSSRDLSSMYMYNYQPPDISYSADIIPAGLKCEAKDKDKDELSNEESEGFLIAHDVTDQGTQAKLKKPLVDCDPNSGSDISDGGKESQPNENRSLLSALQKLMKISKPSDSNSFSSFLKLYLKKLAKTFTLKDLQKSLLNFGVPVSLDALEKVLREFDILDVAGNLNRDKFFNALQPKLKQYSRSAEDRKWVLTYYSDTPIQRFITTASYIGEHKHTDQSKPAGIPSLRDDLPIPNLKKVTDFNEYGDVKSGLGLIQPSVFEKNGIYDEDLGLLRPKKEIKSILYKSGIPFNDESFDIVWKNTSKGGYSSIGSVWNGMKQLMFEMN